jgi:uncharacterized protein (TIGR03083 family)
MSQPNAKLHLVRRLSTERKRLEQNLARLAPEQMLQPGVVGEWSVKDVLAHLAEWEQLCLTWLDASQSGAVPEVPAPGFTWKTIDALNQVIYLKHRDRSLEDVLAWFREVHEGFIARIEDLSDDELCSPGFFPWMKNRPFYNWVSGYCAHDLWGKTKIREWMKAAS